MKFNLYQIVFTLVITSFLFVSCEICTTCTFYDVDNLPIDTSLQICGSNQDVDFFELTQQEKADTINATVICVRE